MPTIGVKAVVVGNNDGSTGATVAPTSSGAIVLVKVVEPVSNSSVGEPQPLDAPVLRWAAVEAVQRVSPHTALGAFRDQVAARRGRNIGVVAAARELTELVFYGMRDGHIRRLAPPASRTQAA